MRTERLDAVRPIARRYGQEERFRRVSHRVSFALDRWPLEQAAVLDVGCGYGNALLHFGEGSLGIDNSREAVDFCREAGLAALQADVERDGLDAVPDGSFNFVWVSDVLEHTDSPRVVLRRLAPKLRAGGLLLVFASVLPENRVARAAFRQQEFPPFDSQAHFQQFTVQTLRHVLERAGYRTTAVKIPTPPWLGRVSGLVPRSLASRVLIEAAPDPDLAELAVRAELRNAPR
jgi:SAM-dependent methyltransferase